MRLSIGKRGTWLNALAMNGVYISPIVWFVAGLYEESVGKQIGDLFSGAVMTVISYQFVKYAVELTTNIPHKEYYKGAMQSGEGLGMGYRIYHLAGRRAFPFDEKLKQFSR